MPKGASPVLSFMCYWSSNTQLSTCHKHLTVLIWTYLSFCFMPLLTPASTHTPTLGLFPKQVMTPHLLWDRELQRVQVQCLPHQGLSSPTQVTSECLSNPNGGTVFSLLYVNQSTSLLYHGRTSSMQLWEQEINAVPSALDMNMDLISIPSCTLLIRTQINDPAAESKMYSLLSSPK